MAQNGLDNVACKHLVKALVEADRVAGEVADAVIADRNAHVRITPWLLIAWAAGSTDHTAPKKSVAATASCSQGAAPNFLVSRRFAYKISEMKGKRRNRRVSRFGRLDRAVARQGGAIH